MTVLVCVLYAIKVNHVIFRSARAHVCQFRGKPRAVIVINSVLVHVLFDPLGQPRSAIIVTIIGGVPSVNGVLGAVAHD